MKFLNVQLTFAYVQILFLMSSTQGLQLNELSRTLYIPQYTVEFLEVRELLQNDPAS